MDLSKEAYRARQRVNLTSVFVNLTLSVLKLIAVAIGIIADAVGRLFEPAPLLVPQPVALVIAVISILANEGLFQYSIRVAKKWRSALLKANAWHHRSDAWS